MPYFTLNYIAPTLQDAAPCFTVTEERTTLSSSQVASLHSLTQYILSNHLPCMSVPSSFPLDPTHHHNTILILQEIIYPIITALRTTSLSPEGLFAIEALEKTFSSDLLQVDLTEFEQPLPIVTEDLVSLNISATSSTSIAISTALLNTPTSYELPFIQIAPDGRSFTLNLYPVTAISNYLEYLHQGVEHVLKNRIFISDPSTATMTSVTSLVHHSLLSLLQLLIDQSPTISLVTNLLEKQDLTQSHCMWINKLTSELKLCGFSNAILNSMWKTETERKSLKNIPYSLLNSSQLLTKTTQSIKKTSSKEAAYAIPLFFIQQGRTLTLPEITGTITILTLKYEVFTKVGKQTDAFTIPRTRMRLTQQNIQRICSPSYHKKDLFRSMDPISKKIRSITFTEALPLIFEGLTENLEFLGEEFPELLKNTPSNFPKSSLEKSLNLITAQLSPNTPPSIISTHILKDMLSSIKTNQSILTNAVLSKKRTSSYNLFPIFFIHLNKGSRNTLLERDYYSYISQYELRVSQGCISKINPKIRASIHATEEHIKNLCSSSFKNSTLHEHQDPFTKEKTTISLSELLLKILEGLKENLLFLPTQFPLVLTNTSVFNPEASLFHSIELVKNKLGLDAPKEDSSPYILKQLLTAVQTQESDNATDDDLLSNDKFDHN
ncbi:hypothetical protein CLAVI_001024 [Candidatus Clavichlamydia salmonicola]|uniref:hypothetical protein n=1 Tax=Candidatus Clavichlamydia salmonicola TaxID=469812 RepID=UPI001890CE32|nr:hypothetical protein [Candidatus Clavichlamydia salmonicola]MBF5051380.1 hypothetical protein [Candidatus Clavichlamydia salmonicola]